MSEYRYTLERSGWMDVDARLCWVMLNPSTADENVDDPTIRRVVRFTQDHGYAALVVVNLFAIRATNPRDLADPDLDIIGPANRDAIRSAAETADAVAYAWGGSIPKAAQAAAADMKRFLSLVFDDPLCLGTTAAGEPRHPLYVSAATRLQPYASKDAA